MDRQRYRPCARTDNRDVERTGAKLLLQRFQAGEPVGIFGLVDNPRKLRTAHDAEIECGQHLGLGRPNFFPPLILSPDRLLERAYDDHPFPRQLRAPRPLMVIRFKRGKLAQRCSGSIAPAGGSLAEVEPYGKQVEAFERFQVVAAKARQGRRIGRVDSRRNMRPPRIVAEIVADASAVAPAQVNSRQLDLRPANFARRAAVMDHRRQSVITLLSTEYSLAQIF